MIGGVSSTEILIRKLHEHGFDQLHVWGFEPADTGLVSGWADLAATCAELGIGYSSFVKVASCQDELQQFAPDLVFAVGLSQLIPQPMLAIARLENVGFHPTALPKGRGRAPIAWLVLERTPGAATFFALRDGVDDGPIFVQRHFDVTEEDDAASVEARILQAEAAALDEWLPLVAAGDLAAQPQDDSAATWYGRRSPEDGWIDWSQPAEQIVRLIRASTHPHPGAISLAADVRLTIWSGRVHERPEQGVVGRILQVEDDESFTVQSGSGLVRVTRWSAAQPWRPKVGAMLGYYPQAEILSLRRRCLQLEDRLLAIEEKLQRLEQPSTDQPAGGRAS